MKRISGIFIILVLIGLIITAGCSQSISSPALPQTSATPDVSLQISGNVGSWMVDVTNLGTSTTSFIVNIDYLEKDVILASESKETPVIATNEKGRVKFFGDGVGAYSIKVKSITKKTGGNVEFTIIDQ